MITWSSFLSPWSKNLSRQVQFIKKYDKTGGALCMDLGAQQVETEKSGTKKKDEEFAYLAVIFFLVLKGHEIVWPSVNQD